MRDVIHSVMATERAAQEMVAAARTEAERISTDAQKKRQDLIGRTDNEARAEAGRMVAAAVKNAELEKAERLTHLAAEIEAEVGLDDGTRQGAAAAAVRCVCRLA
jgi:vacuolar-type H+-ATPase subunit H